MMLGQRDRLFGWMLVRPAWFAIVVGVFAFAVYAATANSLHGYDPETAATAEGFVHTGDFKVLPNSVYAPPGSPGQGVPGQHGTVVGRAGLPQPVLTIPFYLAGWGLDAAIAGDRTPHFRRDAVVFYNPAVTALAAALIFLIVLRLRSLRWAVAIALLFAFASIAWPYSKIGMDNTIMLAVVLTATGVVYASADSSRWPWLLAGFGAGMAAATKAYETLPVSVLLALLIRPWLSAPRGRRAGLLIPSWPRSSSGRSPSAGTTGCGKARS